LEENVEEDREGDGREVAIFDWSIESSRIEGGRISEKD
jgi:hypothetical protein